MRIVEDTDKLDLCIALHKALHPDRPLTETEYYFYNQQAGDWEPWPAYLDASGQHNPIEDYADETGFFILLAELNKRQWQVSMFKDEGDTNVHIGRRVREWGDLYEYDGSESLPIGLALATKAALEANNNA